MHSEKCACVLPPAVFDLLDAFSSFHAYWQYNVFHIKSTVLCQSNEASAHISISMSHL